MSFVTEITYHKIWQLKLLLLCLLVSVFFFPRECFFWTMIKDPQKFQSRFLPLLHSLLQHVLGFFVVTYSLLGGFLFVTFTRERWVTAHLKKKGSRPKQKNFSFLFLVLEVVPQNINKEEKTDKPEKSGQRMNIHSFGPETRIVYPHLVARIEHACWIVLCPSIL